METLSAIILAGGRATRMGGVDKGLVLFQQKPLIKHVIARLKPQADEILINANREIATYQALGQSSGMCILQDISLQQSSDPKNLKPDFIGPLAGFNLGLQYAAHGYLMTVPCDSPLIPLNLANRLMTALMSENAEIAVARSDGDVHPVFSLCKKSVLPSLNTYLNQGGRKVSAWQKSLNYIEVDFSDCSDAFVNINKVEELVALEIKLNANRDS